MFLRAVSWKVRWLEVGVSLLRSSAVIPAAVVGVDQQVSLRHKGPSGYRSPATQVRGLVGDVTDPASNSYE